MVQSERPISLSDVPRFMCYCETTDGELATSIDQGGTKVSELESQLEEDTAGKAQMDQDVAQHKACGM